MGHGTLKHYFFRKEAISGAEKANDISLLFLLILLNKAHVYSHYNGI